MERLAFSAEDQNTWLPVVKRVISVAFPGGFRPPVERCDVEQDCLIRIPRIIADYSGRDGASLDSFVRGAIRNDAKDYLRRIKREPSFVSMADASRRGDKFLDENGRRSMAMPLSREGFSVAGSWIDISPSESVPEEQLERVKNALTADQYRVYLCRFLLGMTQEMTADYLRTTREAVASRQRKIAANLLKVGLPVPKHGA